MIEQRILTMVGIAIFVATVLCVIVALFTEPKRAVIRLLVIFGLTGAILMTCISGYLYIWHHYYR